MDDFVSDLETPECHELIGLSGRAKVLGVGWVEWEIRDAYGQVALIRVRAYYVPDATIRIFSPQAYFRNHQKGHGWFNHCLLYTSPSPRDGLLSRMPSSA